MLQSDSGHVPAAGVDHAVFEIGQSLFMYAYDGWFMYVAPHTQRSMDTNVWAGLSARMMSMICRDTAQAHSYNPARDYTHPSRPHNQVSQ